MVRDRRPGRITRPALTARIVGALEDGSVLLEAPAGYGKTMAVEEALSRHGGAVAWVGCTEDERDPGRLLLAVIEALGRAAPGIAELPAERFAAGAEPVDPVAAARELRAELDRLLVEPLVFVLDDAERLEGATAALEIVRVLLEGGLAVRLVVVTRRRLALRAAKLRAAGRLTTFGAADFVFTAEECAAVLEAREGRPPSTARVATVMSATEGWPLGVALGGLGQEAAGGPEPGSRDAVFDFLGEEVLERLDDRHRDALLVAALPRELDEGAVRALGLDDQVLDDFERLGLFVTPVEGSGRRLRLHPLVREFLVGRLRRERPPAELRRMHAALAESLEAAGHPADAVDHWLQGECWEQAASAIARAAWLLIATAPGTVRGWLERLPADHRGLPEVQLVEGRLEFGAGRHAASAALLRTSVAGLRARGAVRMEWRARLALMDALHAQGAFAEAVDLADGIDSPAVREVPEAPDLAVMAAMCLSHESRFAEAAELNRRAREHPAAGATAPLTLALEGLFIDRPAGRLDDAVHKARVALARFERADPFGRAPFVRALLHLVLEEQGHDEEALRESERARLEARRLGVGGYLETMLLRHSVGIHARAGRLAEAERALAEAGHEHTSGWRQVDVAETTLVAARGDVHEALALAERALARVEQGPWLQRIHAVAFLVPVLAGLGQHARARDAVDATLAGAPDGYALARLRTLRAWLAHLAGDEGRADADLGRAWAEAGDQVAHVVRREWPRVEPLLWPALERGVIDPDALVSAVAAAFPGEPHLARFTTHPVPAVRRAAVAAAVQSGHPDALGRLAELQADADPGVAAAAGAAARLVVREPPALAFTLLGGFAVRRGLWTVDDAAWSRPMAARLCRFLLVHRGTRVTEDTLFEAFWPDKDPAAARRNLQVVLSLLRAVLDPPGAERGVVEVSERTYRLALRPGDTVDADAFLAAADAAASAPEHARAAALERAAELWGGEPLPEDRYAAWSTAWREELVGRYADVLAELAAAYRAAGERPAAMHAARRLVELDPLNERAQRTLMRAYAAAGRRAHALRQYLECRRAMVDELGVEPSAETVRLHARILAGDPV